MLINRFLLIIVSCRACLWNCRRTDGGHQRLAEESYVSDIHLNNELQSFISEVELKYSECNPYHDRAKGCTFGRVVESIIRRVHHYRSLRRESFVTVQIGCFDGYSNDAMSNALIKPFMHGKNPVNSNGYRHSLSNWKGMLVEPVFMKRLKSNYKTFAEQVDLSLSNLYFVDKVVVPENYVSKNGSCKFYKVPSKSKTCSSRLHWLPQISSFNETQLKMLFKDKYNDCVVTKNVPCVDFQSLVLQWPLSHGLRRRISTVTGKTELCCSSEAQRDSKYGRLACGTKSIKYDLLQHRDNTNRKILLPFIDLLLIDTEGSDGDIVRMVLSQLCQQLWPAVIVYEDKVMRYNGNDANGIIKLLDEHGYYVLFVGEDVIALRSGYRNTKILKDIMIFLSENVPEKCCDNVSIVHS